MADLHRLMQNKGETPQQYLTRFMEVMNMIYNADSVAAAGSFIKGLQPGSMLFEDLIKKHSLRYDRDQGKGRISVQSIGDQREAGQESDCYLVRAGIKGK